MACAKEGGLAIYAASYFAVSYLGTRKALVCIVIAGSSIAFDGWRGVPNRCGRGRVKSLGTCANVGARRCGAVLSCSAERR